MWVTSQVWALNWTKVSVNHSNLMSILIGEERTEPSRIGDKNSGDGNISVAFLWPAGISRIILNIVYDEKEIYRFTLNKM